MLKKTACLIGLLVSVALSTTYAFDNTVLELYSKTDASQVTFEADNQLASSPMAFESIGSVALAQDTSGNAIVLRQTHKGCCLSYNFLQIPLYRGWWVAVSHGGYVDYMCAGNMALNTDPKVYLMLKKGAEGTHFTFYPVECAEKDRISDPIYVPSYWDKLDIVM